MTSRLASLLVQDGLVSPKKMAQAFQRQVIYGGTLDTILLEMDAIDEGTLVDAMGRASSLPTAGDLPSKDQLAQSGSREWFPYQLCERYRAVPVSLDGNVVRVLVTDPPDRKQLDELGYHLSRSVDPIVVPEHRFVQAVELVYDVQVPARFASLAAKLRQRASEVVQRVPLKVLQMDAEPPPTRDRLPAVALKREPELRAPAPVTPIASTAPLEAVAAPASEPPAEVSAPTATTVRVPAIEAPPEPPEPEENRRAVLTDVPLPGARPAAVPSELSEAPTPRAMPRQADAPASVPTEMAVQSGAPPEGDTQPLTIEEAAALIEASAERDAIFQALCRGARSQLEFVALLMVHGEVAVGRLALPDTNGQWLPRDAMSALSLPLDKASPFRTTAQGQSPYIGRLGEETLSAQALSSLGRKPPLPGVLLPIVLKDRTVALLYGDGGGKFVDSDLLAGLSTLVAAAGRSFQRLILRQKSGEFAKASAPIMGKASKALAAAAKTVDQPGSAWKRADGDEAKARLTSRGFPALSEAVVEELAARGQGSPATARAQAAPSPGLHDQPTQQLSHIDARPQVTDLQQLVASVMRDQEDAKSSADALLALGERGAEVVVAHLPGPLRLDRHTLRGPMPPLVDHGPLLALLSRFGRAAVKPLVARLDDASLEVRYYATLAAGETRAAEVVPELGQRLSDPDTSVRQAAVQALAGFDHSSELRTLTESLRGDLPGPQSIRQRYAAEALGALRDVPSVPRLIELVKHPDAAVVTAARRALIEITKQDFGTSRWRWRSWWERHRNESRVEWMLEGLAHSEAEVRMSASEELRAMTVESFGYHFDLPKREREEARRRWIDWWRTHGAKNHTEKQEKR
jgi:hypothetical protein